MQAGTSDPMQQSILEASTRLGVSEDAVLSLIVQGKLKAHAMAELQEYIWLKSGEHSEAETAASDGQGPNGSGDAPLPTQTLGEMLRMINKHYDEQMWQLEVKDRQLQEKDNQLDDRAKDIQRLHDLLLQSQEMAMSLLRERRRPGWKFWAREAGE